MKNGASLRKSLEKFFRKYPEFSQDVRFYSRKEWQERKELYLGESPFILTFEGPFYEIFNYGAYPSVLKEFQTIVNNYGFYPEQGYAWSMGFYEK